MHDGIDKTFLGVDDTTNSTKINIGIDALIGYLCHRYQQFVQFNIFTGNTSVSTPLNE
jgi:hypothetical protein